MALKPEKQMQQWVSIVTEHLPSLSKPQATVLALFSFGMVLVKSCALTTVVLILAPLLGVSDNTIRQRLREWYYDKEDKKGNKRAELDVPSCFPFLLRWLVSWWEGKQMALAMDATTLKDIFTVLTISVVYRGCAIPVAWTIITGNEKGTWRKHWLFMLVLLKESIPEDMMVVVFTDRGLYARWLYKRIVKLGWHPFMRINAGGTFRCEGNKFSGLISSLVTKPGETFEAVGTAFKTKDRQLFCTLLAYWAEEYEEPWFLLTDLPPSCSNACWYGMRAWIEHGFRIQKRGFWQWNKTRMREPQRATRLWLVMSVATIWLCSVGGKIDETIPEGTILSITEASVMITKKRAVSVFRRGWIHILFSILFHDLLPFGHFCPEPWPEIKENLYSKT